MIPTFKTAEEAEQFGRQATAHDLLELWHRRQDNLSKFKNAIRQKNINAAMQFSLLAQLDREAIQAKS